jgi:predicted amidohydrolase YtcJ
MQLHLSMQPQFQSTWGGAGGMYDDRVGLGRRTRMNPLRRIVRSGAMVCGGSDAPVCALDPLLGMQAACTGQEPDACLDPHEALALYTVNAARFSHAAATSGNISPGMKADLVVLDRDPFDGAAFSACSILRVF